MDAARTLKAPDVIVNGCNEITPFIYRDAAQGALVIAKQLKGMGQLGQDLWVAAMTGARFGGFFVDIGAFDGVDISNTYMLDKQLGWGGILVEPNPELFKYLTINRGGGAHPPRPARRADRRGADARFRPGRRAWHDRGVRGCGSSQPLAA